jgi:DNA polymerase-3 subunit epsilon
MLDFVTLDFETAAYSPESACSVGLVKYRNGRIISSYYSLIRPPQLYIRPDFTDIHGLEVSDVADAPPFCEIWKEIVPFISGFNLAAHNARFDMNILTSTLVYYDIPVPELRYFCTLELARRVWPELKSHALTSLGKEFNISYNAHNALEDAETCGKIVLLAAEKQSAFSIGDFLKTIHVQSKGAAA